VSLRAKITQAPRKLTSTAATEIDALSVRERCVNRVITPALSSGLSSTIQGNVEFTGSAENDEARMSNDEGMTKPRKEDAFAHIGVALYAAKHE